jgi:NAD(P)-dependent dehydrogenase (short-subunit alcohol dehydrogenase family)
VGPETGGDEQTTVQQGRRLLEVNLLGPFLLCRELGRLMLVAGSGSIGERRLGRRPTGRGRPLGVPGQ